MHLTAQEIAAYRSADNPPELIQRLREHVDNCPECRAKVANPAGAAILRRLLEAKPDEQELMLLAAGKLPSEHTAEIQPHVENCEACARMVAEAREDLGITPARTTRRGWIRWAGLAAAALVCVAGGLIWRSHRPVPAAPMIAVRDGNGTIGLDAAGKLQGLPDLPDDERHWIAEALAARRLPSGAPLRTEAPGQLRSLEEEEVAFEVLGPLNVRVESDRPVFHWEPLSGTSSYQVKVFNDNDEVLARGETREPHWQPPQSLPRETRLAWQVTAVRGNSLVTAPQPPAPRAVFEVISRDAEERLARARAERPQSHLLLAAWYAREGMLVDAQRELSALRAVNPSSAIVEGFENSLGTAQQ